MTVVEAMLMMVLGSYHAPAIRVTYIDENNDTSILCLFINEVVYSDITQNVLHI